MRLAPVEKPSNPILKIAYWMSRRQFGKVLSPLKVIYARKPSLLSFAMKIQKFETKQNSLSGEMRLFIKIAAATLNGCTFCQDIALAGAVREKIGTEKMVALIERDEEKLSVLSEKERAVLAFIREYDEQKQVSDETFDLLKKHFTDSEIVEILALNAFEQFYNAMTIPLGIESDGLREIAEKRGKQEF